MQLLNAQHTHTHNTLWIIQLVIPAKFYFSAFCCDCASVCIENATKCWMRSFICREWESEKCEEHATVSSSLLRAKQLTKAKAWTKNRPFSHYKLVRLNKFSLKPKGRKEVNKPEKEWVRKRGWEMKRQNDSNCNPLTYIEVMGNEEK